jgi:hypothetical protein
MIKAAQGGKTAQLVAKLLTLARQNQGTFLTPDAIKLLLNERAYYRSVLAELHVHKKAKIKLALAKLREEAASGTG